MQGAEVVGGQVEQQRPLFVGGRRCLLETGDLPLMANPARGRFPSHTTMFHAMHFFRRCKTHAKNSNSPSNVGSFRCPLKTASS